MEAVTPTVCGLDLSLTGTGIARADGVCLTVKTNAKRKDARLEDIYTAVLQNLQGADLAVMEDLPYNARQAGTTGMVQGVVRLALMRQGVPYAFVSPATLKKWATGNGRADKPMMAAALIEHHGAEVHRVGESGNGSNVWITEDQILRGHDRFGPVSVDLTEDDAVDAAWLRLAGLARLGHYINDRSSVLDTGKWDKWEGSYAL